MDTSILASVAASYLRTLAPKARTRTVSASEIAEAIYAHETAVSANPGVTIRTRLVGGFVPNSYGYAADADRVEIETDAEGRTTWCASRARAESKAHGRGDALRVWTVTPAGAPRRTETAFAA